MVVGRCPAHNGNSAAGRRRAASGHRTGVRRSPNPVVGAPSRRGYTACRDGLAGSPHAGTGTMDRRRFLIDLAGAAAAVSLAPSLAGAARLRRPYRPNILLI